MSVTHPTTAAGPNDGTKQVSSNAWNEAHTGTIDDAMHGSRGSALHADSHAQSHAHVSHTGIGTDDHHAQLHETTHEANGADPLFSANIVSGTVTVPTDHSYVVTRRLGITGRLIVAGTARVAVIG